MGSVRNAARPSLGAGRRSSVGRRRVILSCRIALRVWLQSQVGANPENANPCLDEKTVPHRGVAVHADGVLAARLSYATLGRHAHRRLRRIYAATAILVADRAGLRQG